MATECRVDSAKIRVRNRDIVLPTSITWIGLCQAVADRKGILMGLQRAIEIALRSLDVAHRAQGVGEIALRTCVTGIGLGQALTNCEAVPISLQRPIKITLRNLDVADLA